MMSVLLLFFEGGGIFTDPSGTIGGQATFVETARKGAMFVSGTTGPQALPVETARPIATLEDT